MSCLHTRFHVENNVHRTDHQWSRDFFVTIVSIVCLDCNQRFQIDQTRQPIPSPDQFSCSIPIREGYTGTTTLNPNHL